MTGHRWPSTIDIAPRFLMFSASASSFFPYSSRLSAFCLTSWVVHGWLHPSIDATTNKLEALCSARRCLTNTEFFLEIIEPGRRPCTHSWTHSREGSWALEVNRAMKAGQSIFSSSAVLINMRRIVICRMECGSIETRGMRNSLKSTGPAVVMGNSKDSSWVNSFSWNVFKNNSKGHVSLVEFDSNWGSWEISRTLRVGCKKHNEISQERLQGLHELPGFDYFATTQGADFERAQGPDVRQCQ